MKLFNKVTENLMIILVILLVISGVAWITGAVTLGAISIWGRVLAFF